MKKQLYFPLLITLLASLIFGVLPWGQPSTVYAAPATLTLLPDGSGNYTNIAVVEPLGAAHWEAVDDPVATPDDTTTYVSTTSATQEKDAYTLQDTTQTGTINSVTVYFRVGGINDKPHDYQPFLRLNATETSGTVQTHSLAAFTTYNQIFTDKPGGVGWTWDDINNLQVAIGLTDTGPGNPICTQVYVAVDYTPPPVDILNSPEDYAFGLLAEGATANTTLTYFMVTNNGSSNVTITIGGTDMIGDFPWILSNDGSASATEYGLKAGRQGDGDYTIIVNKAGGNTLVSNLAASANQSWGLKLYAPTEFSGGGTVSGNVTLTAAQA